VDAAEDLCRPPSLGLYCFGCCSSAFGSALSVEEGLDANTARYRRNVNEWTWLRDNSYGTTPAGLCNLVVRLGALGIGEGPNEIGCPLHKARHDGIERRGADCLPTYECGTRRSYVQWPAQTQRAFLEFLGTVVTDSATYSAHMDTGYWQRKFFAHLQECGEPLLPLIGPSDRR